MHIDKPLRIWFPETLSEYILEQNISYNTSLYHIYKSKPLYLCQKKKKKLSYKLVHPSSVMKITKNGIHTIQGLQS